MFPYLTTIVLSQRTISYCKVRQANFLHSWHFIGTKVRKYTKGIVERKTVLRLSQCCLNIATMKLDVEIRLNILIDEKNTLIKTFSKYNHPFSIITFKIPETVN